ncbi:MAG: aminoacyl-tRNA hydrolase [Alphaproteobacteria bacterium]|nr:aminoacyl-tRNA hydrolase [Alphaproteobacteria bacterium]
MRLIVGLGNPGARYERTRHNVGFLAADAIHRRHGFGPWRAKFQGLLAEGALGGERVYLLKPQTFMNASGDSVGEAANFYKFAVGEVAVVHDEIDLEPGKLRVKQGGGAAGHNGLRSIDAQLGEDYWRVRIGVGHPGVKELVEPYVLQNFSPEDLAWLPPLIDAIADAVPVLVADGAAAFTTRVALILKPNRKEPPAGK